ncbi:MAG: hypothetical protein K2Q20_02185 [Phycisphaerales bacterium]|nr:hypothetical protein [Phycisphaerales bacterium]
MNQTPTKPAQDPLFAVRVGPDDGPKWRVLVRAMTPEQAGALVARRGHHVHSVEPADKPPRTVYRPTTCAVCNYPLRGVSERDGYVQCPECGMVAAPMTSDSVVAILKESRRMHGGRTTAALVVLGLLVVACVIALVVL